MSASYDELEIRIAYQDDTIEQLSQQMYAQSREIERLSERCRQLEQRVQQLGDKREDTPDQPPPHY